MNWRLGHRPALDGLRGLAILFVLLAHFDNPETNPFSGGGKVGVILFFTLSGFLITALLLERQASGQATLGDFYKRRALRLLPALWAVLVVVAVLQATWDTLGVSRGMWFSTLFSVSNWWLKVEPGYSALAHTWSLGIEEQFYIVWPALLLIAFARGRAAVYGLLGVGVVVSLAAISIGDAAAIEWGTLQHAFGLLAGCLLAVWMGGRPERLSRPLVVGVALVALLPLLVLRGAIPDAAYLVVVPVFATAALWGAASGPSIGFLSGPVLRWFGRRSYGIYLWHYLIVAVGFQLDPPGPWWAINAVTLAVSLVVAELSWRLIEAPAQRLRGSRQPADQTGGTLVAGTVAGCRAGTGGDTAAEASSRSAGRARRPG